MKFKKGQSGNPSGRPLGTPNKVTTNIRDQLQLIVDEYFDSGKVVVDMNSMEPKDRLAFLSRILDYLIPRLRAEDMNLNMNFEQWPEEMRINIINELLNIPK